MRAMTFIYLSFITFSTIWIVQASPANAQLEHEPSYISVEADSWVSVSPDFLRLTVIIEQSASSAKDAQNQLQQQKAKMQQAFTVAGLNSVGIRIRDIDYFPGKGHTKPIKPAQGITARQILAIETSTIHTSAALIDIIQQFSNTSIQDVTAFVLSPQQQRIKGIKEASLRAKEKAQTLANSLNISLGELVYANILEDPAGEMLLRRRELGKNQLAYGDKDIHIIVSQKYKITLANNH